MSKTNFTKVEEALRDGLDKILKDKLLEEADVAQGKEPKKQHAADQLLAKIKNEFKYLYKRDKAVFSKLGIEENVLKDLITSKDFTSQDLTKLQDILKKIEAYKAEVEKTTPKKTDDEIIEEESKKHINKRFNVNDKWLPLK